jgi:hypothetical protein
VLSRSESHWCDGCFRGRAPGNGLTADYRCEDCDGPEPKWTEHTVDRSDAAGIANRRVLAQAAGHKRAAKLAGAGGVGKFIIVQARMRWSMAESAHVRSGHYWLARTVETAPGSGTCIEKIEERRTSRSSTVFTKGDYAISVEWFDRIDADAMGLSFSKWIPDDDDDESEMPSIINSTELRAIEGQPIDLDSTDSLALSVIPTKQIEPALVPPPPPAQKRSPRLAEMDRPQPTAGARVSKGGEGVGVQARPAAASLPLDAVVEVRAELDAAVRGQCW